MRCRWREVIGSIITVFTSTNATMPMGRFTKNTHRHESWSVRKPPMNGPTIDANPNVPDRTAETLARCSSV